MGPQSWPPPPKQGGVSYMESLLQAEGSVHVELLLSEERVASKVQQRVLPRSGTPGVTMLLMTWTCLFGPPEPTVEPVPQNTISFLSPWILRAPWELLLQISDAATSPAQSWLPSPSSWKSWAGDLPIPEERKTHPLPPFKLVRNKLNKLEFRMNLMKPIGCIQFQMILDVASRGTFQTGWRHTISVHFLPGKDHAIAYFKGKIQQTYQMTMLMGRTLEKDPEALSIFEKFVKDKGLNKITAPPHLEACELPRES
ncbi:odorant-binding protein 2b-like [Urocitellus parryii]